MKCEIYKWKFYLVILTKRVDEKMEPRSIKHKTNQSKIIKLLNYKITSPFHYMLFMIVGLIASILFSYALAMFFMWVTLGF